MKNSSNKTKGQAGPTDNRPADHRPSLTRGNALIRSDLEKAVGFKRSPEKSPDRSSQRMLSPIPQPPFGMAGFLGSDVSHRSAAHLMTDTSQSHLTTSNTTSTNSTLSPLLTTPTRPVEKGLSEMSLRAPRSSANGSEPKHATASRPAAPSATPSLVHGGSSFGPMDLEEIAKAEADAIKRSKGIGPGLAKTRHDYQGMLNLFQEKDWSASLFGENHNLTNENEGRLFKAISHSRGNYRNQLEFKRKMDEKIKANPDYNMSPDDREKYDGRDNFLKGHVNEARGYAAQWEKYEGMSREERGKRDYYPQAGLFLGGMHRIPDLMKIKKMMMGNLYLSKNTKQTRSPKIKMVFFRK